MGAEAQRESAHGAGPIPGNPGVVPSETSVPLSLLGLGGIHVALLGLGFLLPDAKITPLRMTMGLASFIVIFSAIALLAWPRLAAHAHRIALAGSLLLLATILVRAALRPDVPIAVVFAVHTAAIGFVLPSRRSFLLYGMAAFLGWLAVLLFTGLPEPASWTSALSIAAFLLSFGINTAVLAVRRRDQEMHMALERERTAMREANSWHQERERALLLLSEAERLAHIGSWEWNIATGETTWSSELYRIFGRDLDAGPPGIEAYLLYVPEEERENLRLVAQKVVQESRIIETRHHILKPDGKRRTVEVRGHVVDDPLRETGILRGIIRDVTESEQGEERFRGLIEAAPDSMVIVDGSGRIALVNRQTERVFGYSREELIGEMIECLVPPDSRERHVDHREAYQLAPIPRAMGVGGILYGLRKDGTRIPVEISLSPLERDGELFITAAIRDVSDRQRMAEADRIAFERLLKIQQLTEIDRMKTSLFNTASHELNTPLTPLKMQVYLLRSGHFGPVSEEQLRSLDILDRNLERLSKLNKDILDVARLQSGHLVLRRRNEDLASLSEDAVTAFVDTAKEKGIGLSAKVCGHPIVHVDRGRIEQVLYNLLSNSLRYTPSGGTICVRVSVEEEEARVSVRDTGIGMTPEQISRLFEPFSQVHDPDADRHQTGTGLGLFISREIARRHGGSLGVVSDGPGRGSMFVLALPLHGKAMASASSGLDLVPEKEAL